LTGNVGLFLPVHAQSDAICFEGLLCINLDSATETRASRCHCRKRAKQRENAGSVKVKIPHATPGSLIELLTGFSVELD